MSSTRIRPDQDEELIRLRKKNNSLFRALWQTRAEQSREIQALSDSVEALQRELTAIKNSRVWRTASRIKALLPGMLNGARNPEAKTPLRSRREEQYLEFLKASDITAEKRAEIGNKANALAQRPLISVVMPVYNVAAEWLVQAVDSVIGQIYDHWELCVVDDGSQREDTRRQLANLEHPRLRTRRLERNCDIAAATNAAIDMTDGEYVAFLDHDDRLAPDALAEVAVAVNETGADFIYTDEDHVEVNGERRDPHFKPDYSPDLLLSHNYMTHLVVVRRDLLDRVGGLRSEFDGAQDYDFVLRATEAAKTIVHIPKVLYHWRMSAGSTSLNAASKPRAAERGRQALVDALKRRSRGAGTVVDANVPYFYRVKYAISGEPRVSIIIPFKDRADLLHCVIGDILEKSTYVNFEILGVSNNSEEEETADAMRDLAGIDSRVRFLDYDAPFNFSAIVNHGAMHASGEHLVLMNNDIRLISEDWIEALLEHSQREEVGAVGGKLYYPDGRVQHAGVIVGIGGYAGHAHKGFPGSHQGYYNRLQVVQNVSAVTGAFMMVRKEAFETIGGFNEEDFGVACNDVDFCLRARERGYWNVFTPYAQACHLESASRGYEETPERISRFARERERFAERHQGILDSGDPFYNRNLTTTAEDFTLRPRRPGN